MDENDPKVKKKKSVATKCEGTGICVSVKIRVLLSVPKAWVLKDEAKAVILDTAEEEIDQTPWKFQRVLARRYYNR